MEKNINERYIYIDIAKGILIFLVVVGHSAFPFNRIIFWFHMPAFFMISGILFKTKNDMAAYLSWSKKITMRYMIPYIAYFLMTTLTVMLMTNNFVIVKFIKQSIKFLYGGRLISGVYWFITCILLTELLFGLIIIKMKKKSIIVLLIISYLFAHIESYLLISSNNYIDMAAKYRYPFNIDTVLIAIVYYAIGFYVKELLNKLPKRFIVFGMFVGLVASSVLIYLGKNNLLDYNLDMKYSQYRHLILDLAIPLLFTMTIILISMTIQEFKVLRKIEYIGENTLSIMYLHIPLNEILSNKFHYGYGMYILIGVALPIMFSIFIKQFKIINYIFTGRYYVQAKKSQ